MKAPQMRKAAAGGQAAFLNTSNDTAKNNAPTKIKQRAKRLIVGMALWGWLSIPVADWIIQHGGLSDA
ncbi:MAG: hypothetical protein ACYDC8_08695 [Gammaproteobacteria bacterium]